MCVPDNNACTGHCLVWWHTVVCTVVETCSTAILFFFLALRCVVQSGVLLQALAGHPPVAVRGHQAPPGSVLPRFTPHSAPQGTLPCVGDGRT